MMEINDPPIVGTSLGTKPVALVGTSLGGTSLGATSLGGKLNVNSSVKKEDKEITTKPEKEPQTTTKKNISNITQQTQKGSGQTTYVIKAHRDSDLEHVSSDEEEDEKDYKNGGYCPIRIGMQLNKNYEIEKKLGWGHFSTVWLCADKEKNTQVAIKILKSAKNYREAALDEIHILTTIKQADSGNVHCILQLLDNFEVQSQFGRHIAMVFEKLGCNLLLLIRIYKYRCIPIPLVKIITKQMLLAIAFLHKCQIIHTDLKPENLMLVHTPDFVKHLSKYVEKDPAHDREKETNSERDHLLIENQFSPLASLSTELVSSSDSISASTNISNTYTPTSQPEDPSTVNAPLLTNSSIGNISVEGSNISLESAEFGSLPILDKVTEVAPIIQLEDSKESKAVEAKSEEKKTKQKFTPPKTNDELREVFGKDNMWKLKVVDLGNACWVFKHFSTDVQTREYRAPEVILGASYGTPIDIWSAACIVFELLTGDQLFKPKESRHFGKDDDHLALIIELLGEQKTQHLIIGKYGKHFFDPNGDLKNIKKLKYWPLQQVLVEKYKLPAQDAKEISEFLLPMLFFNAQKRFTAVKCLQQPWIANVDVNNFESIF
jgi:serine/threonine protein kinase